MTPVVSHVLSGKIVEVALRPAVRAHVVNERTPTPLSAFSQLVKPPYAGIVLQEVRERKLGLEHVAKIDRYADLVLAHSWVANDTRGSISMPSSLATGRWPYQ